MIRSMGFQILGYVISIGIFLLFSISCTNTREVIETEKTLKNETIKIAFAVRGSITEDIFLYISLIKYLENETGYSFKLILPNQNGYENNYPLNENIDIGIVGAVHAIKGIKSGWKVIVLGKDKNMKTEYRSVLIVPIDSDIKSINDIRGNKIVFGSYYSTSGHLIPRIEMEKSNIKLDELQLYTYTGSHYNCIHSVYRGEHDAGFLQEILAEKMEKQNIVKIIWYSDYYPSSCVITSPFLDDTIAAIIKQALIDIKPLSDDSLILYKWDETEMAGGFTDGDNEHYKELIFWIDKFNIVK